MPFTHIPARYTGNKRMSNENNLRSNNKQMRHVLIRSISKESILSNINKKSTDANRNFTPLIIVGCLVPVLVLTALASWYWYSKKKKQKDIITDPEAINLLPDPERLKLPLDHAKVKEVIKKNNTTRNQSTIFSKSYIYDRNQCHNNKHDRNSNKSISKNFNANNRCNYNSLIYADNYLEDYYFPTRKYFSRENAQENGAESISLPCLITDRSSSGLKTSPLCIPETTSLIYEIMTPKVHESEAPPDGIGHRGILKKIQPGCGKPESNEIFSTCDDVHNISKQDNKTLRWLPVFNVKKNHTELNRRHSSFFAVVESQMSSSCRTSGGNDSRFESPLPSNVSPTPIFEEVIATETLYTEKQIPLRREEISENAKYNSSDSLNNCCRTAHLGNTSHDQLMFTLSIPSDEPVEDQEIMKDSGERESPRVDKFTERQSEIFCKESRDLFLNYSQKLPDNRRCFSECNLPSNKLSPSRGRYSLPVFLPRNVILMKSSVSNASMNSETLLKTDLKEVLNGNSKDETASLFLTNALKKLDEKKCFSERWSDSKIYFPKKVNVSHSLPSFPPQSFVPIKASEWYKTSIKCKSVLKTDSNKMQNSNFIEESDALFLNNAAKKEDIWKCYSESRLFSSISSPTKVNVKRSLPLFPPQNTVRNKSSALPNTCIKCKTVRKTDSSEMQEGNYIEESDSLLLINALETTNEKKSFSEVRHDPDPYLPQKVSHSLPSFPSRNEIRFEYLSSSEISSTSMDCKTMLMRDDSAEIINRESIKKLIILPEDCSLKYKKNHTFPNIISKIQTSTFSLNNIVNSEPTEISSHIYDHSSERFRESTDHLNMISPQKSKSLQEYELFNMSRKDSIPFDNSIINKSKSFDWKMNPKHTSKTIQLPLQNEKHVNEPKSPHDNVDRSIYVMKEHLTADSCKNSESREVNDQLNQVEVKQLSSECTIVSKGESSQNINGSVTHQSQYNLYEIKAPYFFGDGFERKTELPTETAIGNQRDSLTDLEQLMGKVQLTAFKKIKSRIEVNAACVDKSIVAKVAPQRHQIPTVQKKENTLIEPIQLIAGTIDKREHSNQFKGPFYRNQNNCDENNQDTFSKNEKCPSDENDICTKNIKSNKHARAITLDSSSDTLCSTGIPITRIGFSPFTEPLKMKNNDSYCADISGTSLDSNPDIPDPLPLASKIPTKFAAYSLPQRVKRDFPSSAKELRRNGFTKTVIQHSDIRNTNNYTPRKLAMSYRNTNINPADEISSPSTCHLFNLSPFDPMDSFTPLNSE